ncbi:hypothetical protein NC653_027151 [Populus alba x Populus x berolinensis]|uniref:Uncharacterized protein n=1 Tax=Populus alba x Populus x berolinensis TaxID=444605 RepID=A0AAD6M4J0_9ROSI|nr:hypothetical protein NC653_027151 [Populus alba x Populus x berolinensis]
MQQHSIGCSNVCECLSSRQSADQTTAPFCLASRKKSNFFSYEMLHGWCSSAILLWIVTRSTLCYDACFVLPFLLCSCAQIC